MGKSPLPTPPALEPGIYEHFKGGRYLVLGVEIDSENKDKGFRVAYFSLEQKKWLTRPYSSNKYLPDDQRCGFTDEVSRDGYQGPRFKRVEQTTQDLKDALSLALPEAFQAVLKASPVKSLFEGQGRGPYAAGY
jgi:hypothetical protein